MKILVFEIALGVSQEKIARIISEGHFGADNNITGSSLLKYKGVEIFSR